MRVLLIFALAFFSIACNRQDNLFSPHKPSTKQEAVNEIRLRAAGKIKRKYGLQPFGTAGQLLDQVKMIGLSFQYHKPIDIEEGRKLLIGATNELLAEINANEDVRPYLDKYPFETKNVRIEIVLRNPDGSTPVLGSLVLIKAQTDILSYDTSDPQTHRLTTILQETFEEALLKIQDTQIE